MNIKWEPNMKTFRIRLFIGMVVFLQALTMHSAKLQTLPWTNLQSDGTKLTVRGYGNEDMHFWTTTDGALLFHQGTDFYVASISENGILRPTQQLAHAPGERTAIEQQLIASQNRNLFYGTFEQMATKARQRREPVVVNSTFLTHMGSPRVPVILVQFNDTTFMDSDPKIIFEQYLNVETIDKTVGNQTVGRNYGSVRKYFSDMSYGQFTPQFDIYGPITLPKPTSYYGSNEQVNEGTAAEYTKTDHMDLFVPDVCKAIDSELDFSQYDANNDGCVDLIYIIYAGYAESNAGNSSDCIWPKSGAKNFGKYDGKTVYRYSVNSERNGTPTTWAIPRINGIGLFCHEFSHCLGLPDIYPTVAQAQMAGVSAMEYWDLMDGGEYVQWGYYPAEYTAWERESLGWMSIDTLRNEQEVELSTLANNGKAYRILNEDDPTGHEYAILENVQKTGWNAKLLGHGLMITHIDYDKSLFSLEKNAVNNTVGHPRYTLFPADGEIISSYLVDEKTITTDMYVESHRGDLYPGSLEVTEIDGFNFYTGLSQHQLTDITENEETGNISFRFSPIRSGITTINTDEREKNPAIYNLAGQKVTSPRNGVYVVNGKKMIIGNRGLQ